MALNWPVVGIANAAAYEVSAVPWVTSSYLTTAGNWVGYGFDTVTKYVQVRASGSNICLAVGFSELGIMSSSNFVLIGGNETRTMDVRTTQVFIKLLSGSNANFDVFAGLTAIPTSQMPVLTASNGFDGIG